MEPHPTTVTYYEVGGYISRDLVAFGISPKIEGLIVLLIGQSAKHFGIAFAIDLRISENGRFWVGCGLEICFSKDCYIIPPSLASAEFFYHQTTR